MDDEVVPVGQVILSSLTALYGSAEPSASDSLAIIALYKLVLCYVMLLSCTVTFTFTSRICGGQSAKILYPVEPTDYSQVYVSSEVHCGTVVVYFAVYFVVYFVVYFHFTFLWSHLIM